MTHSENTTRFDQSHENDHERIGREGPQRVRIEGLTKYFGNKIVLDNVSLGVSAHEVVCLIGASGSGKSTLLRCVSDLVEFEDGEISEVWSYWDTLGMVRELGLVSPVGMGKNE